MKKLTIATVLAALVATGLAGCGDKNKKPTTVATETPDRDDSEGKDQKQPSVDRDDDQLPTQPDPAALGQVIYFEFDSTTLSQEARDTLTENAEWLKQDPARRLTIEGHTDEVGTDEYNLALGERRARAALEYLKNLGVEADRVDVLTYGEEKPASDTDEGNRRAMFIAGKPRA